MRINGDGTAFSTSCGFESHVPRPIWGMVAPVLRVITFRSDMVEEKE